MEEEYTNVITIIQTMETSLKKLNKEMKMIKKKYKTLSNEYNKINKQQTKKGQRPRSGIHKPCKVSNEMCAFMNLPTGSSVARTDATVAINSYIRSMKLQNAENKRQFILDTELKKLFNTESNKVTYFEIPKLMNIHFSPNSKTTT